MKLNFVPFKSVGNFILGDTIDNYISHYAFSYYPDEDNIGLDTYDLFEIGISLNVRNDTKIIDFIICRKELYYIEKTS